MSIPERFAASRANGAKSRGPVTVPGKVAARANSAKSTGRRTPEGKARSSQNALRHGILAESVVLDSESREAFSEILSTLDDELQPASPIERRFVETMALKRAARHSGGRCERNNMEWRRETRRQESAQSDSLAAATSDAPSETTMEVSPMRYTALAFKAMADQSRAQELLNRYESRYDRQYTRALAGLRAHRAEKRKTEQDVRRSARAQERARKARLRMRRLRSAQKTTNEKRETK